ncbi:MAG: secondary thiamine-phosphate synthase enzyme YjbQ [Candidatus Methylacidiphilales bacterium]
MYTHTSTFTVKTRGQGTYEITSQVAAILASRPVQHGLCTVFVAHTSASLLIFENADPEARTDLHAFFERLCPENEDYFVHTAEGSDDMPAHLRMALTRTSEVIPIQEGRLVLGTWQGLFLFEHRRAPHARRLSVNITGI